MEGKKKTDYKEIILKSLLVVGALSVAVMAPNALQIFKPLLKDKKKENFKYLLNRKIFLLQKKGYIYFINRDGKKFATLAAKGKKEIDKYLLGDLQIKKPKKWDKKWRIVSFDVKNTRTPLRNLLRHHLKRLGFVQYQKSIWIHPYECEEVIIMMKSYFKFGKEVMYIVAEHLENDRELKNNFDLK
jgi:DNA-binding transcriptional regulator PaaX